MDTPPEIAKKSLSNSLTKNSLTPCRRVGLGRPSSGSLNKQVQVRTISTPLHGSSLVTNHNSLPEISENLMHVTPASDLPLRVSLKPNYGENKEVTKVRRCLTQNIKSKELQSVKRTVHENEVETDIMLNEVSVKSDGFVRDSYYICQFKKHKSELSSPINSKTITEVYENKNLLVCKSDSTKTLADCTFENNKGIQEEIIVQLVLSLLEKKKKLDQLKVRETYAKKHNLEELRAQSAKWKAAGQEALRHCVRLAGQAGYSVSIPQLMQQHGFPPDIMGYNPDDDEFE